MKKQQRHLLLFGFILTFFVGLGTGVLLQLLWPGKGLPFYGPRYSRNESPREREKARLHFEKKITHDLGLTDEQKRKIFPIIESNANKANAIKEESFRRVREIFTNSQNEMAKYLTPEQVVKLKNSLPRPPSPPPPPRDQ